ncbi:MAG: hypothetical protein NTX49_08640 [Chlamydiae bacterium]|nr:hypothetical protein [Chlamydiota bacterium]
MPGKNFSRTTRMSIDIPIKDHKRIKILASAEGVTLKDFVIGCIQERMSPEKKPNAKTCKAMNDARKGKTFKAKDLSDLYDELGI